MDRLRSSDALTMQEAGVTGCDTCGLNPEPTRASAQLHPTLEDRRNAERGLPGLQFLVDQLPLGFAT